MRDLGSSHASLRICLGVPHLAPYTKTNGIAWYNRWLADGLARRGHRVTVVDVSPVRGDGRTEPWERTVVPEPKRSRLPSSLRHALFMREFIRTEPRFDILETSNWPGLAAFHSKQKVGATLIRLITPSSPASFRRPQNAVCNALGSASVRRADGIIASTEYIANVLSERYRKDLRGAYRVPFGLPDVPQSGRRSESGPLRLLAIGRAEHRKGSDVLLAALVEAMERDAGFVVTLAGSYVAFSNESAVLQTLWKTLLGRFEDRVTVIDDLEEHVKLDLLAESDYLLMTSRSESFGLPVIEAMRAGTAVISSSGGGLREVAGASPGNIIYEDPENAASLGRAIARAIAGGKAEAASRGREGRRIFSEQFHEDVFLDRTIAAYRAALERRA